MGIQDLENEVIHIQNQLMVSYNILNDIWVYHPANPDFTNPIKAYDELKKSILALEVKLANLELKLKTLKSAN